MLKWDFELEYAHTNIYHAQMQLLNIHSYNYMSCTAELTCIPSSIHLTCLSFSLTENIVAEVKMDKITYLMMNLFRNQLRRCNVPPNHRPACSLISQQGCHPQAGHDSPRNKGTSRLTHSQGCPEHSQGCPEHSQANTVGFIKPLRSWRRQIAKLVSSS